MSPRQRTQTAIDRSALSLKIATYVICHTLVECQELLAADERLSTAHAFLQRATSTHLCNHKLTTEGLVYEFRGQPFELHEEFKTMTLTRSVYEHLAMFFFLFEHPHNDEEREIVWKYWQLNSKKSQLDFSPAGDAEERKGEIEEMRALRKAILQSRIGRECAQKLDEWTAIETPASTGALECFRRGGRYDVLRVSYSLAWRYLFHNDEMALLYSHLSMHCHPVFSGLVQYQNQATADEGDDAIPLYFSACFLAYLCRLFLRLVPGGDAIVSNEFSADDLRLFAALSHIK